MTAATRPSWVCVCWGSFAAAAALPHAAVFQGALSCHQQQGRAEQHAVEPMHGAWVHIGGPQVAQVVADQEHMRAWQPRFMGLCCRPYSVCVVPCCCIAAAGRGGGGGGGSACVSWAVSLHTRGREWHLHSCALSELYQASQCDSILRCLFARHFALWVHPPASQGASSSLPSRSSSCSMGQLG